MINYKLSNILMKLMPLQHIVGSIQLWLWLINRCLYLLHSAQGGVARVSDTQSTSNRVDTWASSFFMRCFCVGKFVHYTLFLRGQVRSLYVVSTWIRSFTIRCFYVGKFVHYTLFLRG